MRSKTIWLSKDALNRCYELSRTKQDAMLCANGDALGAIDFGVQDFEKLTGIKLKAGEVRKVRLEVDIGKGASK